LDAEEKDMDSGQLKRLAVKARELLASWEIEISHGQALDLVAALPGLRNWPEVIAFPDRVAACEIDLNATGRLARRIGTRFADRLNERATRRLDADGLMNELAPWTLLEPCHASSRERIVSSRPRTNWFGAGTGTARPDGISGGASGRLGHRPGHQRPAGRATERRLLERVAEDGASRLNVMPWMHTLDDQRVFS